MKSFGCKRTEPVIHIRADSRSVPRSLGAPAGFSPGPVTSRLVGRRSQAPGGGSSRGGRVLAVVPRPNPGGPGRLARRQEPSTRPANAGPSVGDEFRATFRPVLKHGPRSLTCTRVNGARGPRGGRARKTTFGAMKVIYGVGPRPGARTTARQPNPPGFTVAPVRSPGAYPPGRLRPAGCAPLAYTLVPERW